jgi:hypothetical protein
MSLYSIRGTYWTHETLLCAPFRACVADALIWINKVKVLISLNCLFLFQRTKAEVDRVKLREIEEQDERLAKIIQEQETLRAKRSKEKRKQQEEVKRQQRVKGCFFPKQLFQSMVFTYFCDNYYIIPSNLGLPWSWPYGSWIYNCLWNQCLSPLMLWVRILLMARCILDRTLCDKVFQ